MPKRESKEITELFGDMKRGWGSLPVKVIIGGTSWKTSIFPTSQSMASRAGQDFKKNNKTYWLPLKADVRKKESIAKTSKVNFFIEIQQ